jgi:hypothetical protein
LIRGTVASGSIAVRNYEGIGSMYPDLGIVVLNPKALQSLIGPVSGFNIGPTSPNDLTYLSQWGSDYAQLTKILFKSLQTASSVSGSNKPMKARVTEYVPARHFFVRVKNQDFNYSNNPTFVITDSDNPASSQDIGKLRFADFSTDPKVYVTTVGLYNESNDLVAVAKLSQPVLKDFTNECLIRIRLDF